MRSRRYPLRGRPVLSGLLWTALFVPLFLVLMLASGNPLHGLVPILFLCGLSILGGLAWGYTMNAFFKGRGDRQ